MNAFDTTGPSVIASELETKKRISRATTKSVEKKRNEGVDLGRMWGLSQRWDEQLMTNPKYLNMKKISKTK